LSSEYPAACGGDPLSFFMNQRTEPRTERKLIPVLSSKVDFSTVEQSNSAKSKYLQIAFLLSSKSGQVEQSEPIPITAVSEIEDELSSFWEGISNIANKPQSEGIHIGELSNELYELVKQVFGYGPYLPEKHTFPWHTTNTDFLNLYAKLLLKTFYEKKIPNLDVDFKKLGFNTFEGVKFEPDDLLKKINTADFSGLNLKGSKITIRNIEKSCSFKDANLENANIEIHPSLKTELDFRGANLTNLSINSTAFENGVFDNETKIEGLKFNDPWRFEIDLDKTDRYKLEKLTEFYTLLHKNNFTSLMNKNLVESITIATINICNQNDIGDAHRATKLAPVAKIFRSFYQADISNQSENIMNITNQIKSSRDKILFLAHFMNLFDQLDRRIKNMYSEHCKLDEIRLEEKKKLAI